MSDSPTPTGDGSIELIAEGDEKTVAGFIRGLFVGAGNTDWPVFHDELGIESETFAEQLKGWVGLSEPLTHLVVDDDALTLVRGALADPRCHDIRLRDARPILFATFSFKFKVFTEEAGSQVRGIFDKLPAGVTIEGWAPEVTRLDESAEGIELYTPLHHYRLEGRGVVRGPFRRVLYVHEQARRVEQIDEEKMKLEVGATLI